MLHNFSVVICSQLDMFVVFEATAVCRVMGSNLDTPVPVKYPQYD